MWIDENTLRIVCTHSLLLTPKVLNIALLVHLIWIIEYDYYDYSNKTQTRQ